MKPRSHQHDWQWSEHHQCYLCACGAAQLADEQTHVAQIRPINAEQTLCWSCLGSGHSDFAIGQPCAVCGGFGYGASA